MPVGWQEINQSPGVFAKAPSKTRKEQDWMKTSHYPCGSRRISADREMCRTVCPAVRKVPLRDLVHGIAGGGRK